jgi:hypothetical protein
MPLDIAMKTEELIRALAMDSTLPRASPHADGPPRFEEIPIAES